MNENRVDDASIAGKQLSVAETSQVLVVGAGPAGCIAAIAAAEQGLGVVLVDENPIDHETMGNEVPLHFGGRMTGAVRNRTAMTEAIVASNPLIASAFDAGVDVRLGTSCWGLYLPAPTARWPPRPVAGLVDAESSWHLGFDHVVVAAGCRDMGVAFPGWELPGVMGAAALERLACGYGASSATRAVVLGSGPMALRAVEALRGAGGACAAVVECAGQALGGEATARALDAAGVELLTDHAIARAEAGDDGVRAVVATRIDADARPVPGTERTIECDTVVLAVAAVPCIELLDACGCRTEFDPARGGQVPVLDADQRTTRPAVFVVGDAAGVWSAKSDDATVVRAEASRAVAAIVAARDGAVPDAAAAPVTASEPTYDLDGYLRRWVTASVVEADGAPFVCQCEEVTARDLLEVRPPNYLAWTPPTQKPADLRAMLGNGPPSPDLVKRLTRAGMGQCQGRRCREQVAVLLALESGLPLGEIPPATHRPPVRPVPLDQLAEWDEDPALTEHWHPWFGMDSQWIPYWELEGAADAGGDDVPQAQPTGDDHDR